MANQRTGGRRTRRIVFAVHPGNQGNQTTSWLVDDSELFNGAPMLRKT